MRIIFLVGLMASLNIFNCANVLLEDESSSGSKDTVEKPLNLDGLPEVLLFEIGFFLDHELWRLASLNHELRKTFSKFPVKRVFKKRFDIPELVTEDVAENEKELMYLLPLHKFTDPNHLFKALSYELYFGDTIKTLRSHLFNYFYLNIDRESNYFGNDILVKRINYQFLFVNDAALFNAYTFLIFSRPEYIPNIQQHLLLHPEHLDHVRDFISNKLTFDPKDLNFFLNWVMAALASNMPDTFIFGFPYHLLAVLGLSRSYLSIWTRLYIPRERYNEIYTRINNLIESLPIDNKSNLLLLNSIRFGPENSNNILKIIKSRNNHLRDIFSFCHCASLANKMDQFTQLLPAFIRFIQNGSLSLDVWFDGSGNTPLEMYKFLIDIHEHSDQSVRQVLYDDSSLIPILSKYCRVISLEWNENENESTIVYKTPKLEDSGIPEQITIIRKFESNYLLMDWLSTVPYVILFENKTDFESFMLFHLQQFEDRECVINIENLKLLLHSEIINQKLPEIFTDNRRPNYSIEMKKLLDIIDEPVPQTAANYHLICWDAFQLSEFKTFQQLQNLEALFGHSISKFIENNFDYFKYRHIFKYLIQTGQELPQKLSEEARTLSQIDFPQLIN